MFPARDLGNNSGTLNECIGDLASTEDTKRLTDEMRVEKAFDDSSGSRPEPLTMKRSSASLVVLRRGASVDRKGEPQEASQTVPALA
jgi:hypothetical protein